MFGTLEITTGAGTGTGACKPRHRHQERGLLKQVVRAYPDDGTGTELHLLMDNYAAHKRVVDHDWLENPPPRIHVQFTPTSGRGATSSSSGSGSSNDSLPPQILRLRHLNAKIRALIVGWNDRCHSFVWTKSAEQILAKPNG